MTYDWQYERRRYTDIFITNPIGAFITFIILGSLIAIISGEPIPTN